MRNIRQAFNRFDSDCVLTDERLEDIADYGLWPLMTRTHPNGGDNYFEYDYEKGKGWRGPYIEREGEMNINNSLEGQPDGTVAVPVINDPYGGYYRVIIPSGESAKKIVLVCTGKNGILETASSDKHAATGNLEAQGDDTVLMLLPCGQ